jgi:hypothetical protein
VARQRLLALVVVLVAGGALVAVAVVASAGKGGKEAGLKIERSGAVGGGGPELVVYVQDRGANTLKTSHGKSSVTLECTDKAGRVLLRVPEPWPLGFPDGTYLDPHVHQPVDPGTGAKLVRCRFAGTEPLLKGDVGGPSVR